MAAKKAKSSNSDKTASMTVRLDPKLKYGLEILARKQYRNLSSLVEWALNKALMDPHEGLPYLESIWDVYEADRLVKLAVREPNLLTYDEQKIWKLIKENGACWKGWYTDAGWSWTIAEENAVWECIRRNWDKFVAVAKGNMDHEELPTWVKQRKLEDEIPF